MATRYLELPPDEDENDPTPGLVVVESHDKAIAYLVSRYGKERAIEILAANHMAEGYPAEEARAMAVEDIEGLER